MPGWFELTTVKCLEVKWLLIPSDLVRFLRGVGVAWTCPAFMCGQGGRTRGWLNEEGQGGPVVSCISNQERRVQAVVRGFLLSGCAVAENRCRATAADFPANPAYRRLPLGWRF